VVERHLAVPILLSITAAVLTMGLKAAAYLVTGSVGLLSDAAESLVNLTCSLVAYAALWYSARPVDRSHTYGHEKIEYFSSGLEGSLILVAAVGTGIDPFTKKERQFKAKEARTVFKALPLKTLKEDIK